MLQIDIAEIDDLTGGLILKEYGHQNYGHSHADKGDPVHWKVKKESGVKYIHAITRKTISGTTDIFSSDPPSKQNDTKTHWKGTVNDDAEDYSVYVYSIEWVKDDGSTDIKVFDPIISIKPSAFSFKILVTGLVTICLGLVGISLLFRRKKKSSK